MAWSSGCKSWSRPCSILIPAVSVAERRVFGADVKCLSYPLAGDHLQSLEGVQSFQHARIVNLAAQSIELPQQLPPAGDTGRFQPPR